MTQISDGRNIDSRIGTLSGEGSQQKVTGGRVHKTDGALPTFNSAGSTYYDRPVIKKSVWSWTIPAYYYVGGATGASMALAAAATLLNREALADLILQSRIIGVSGGAISAGLLIHDLGRPSRFLNMLRVFRPSSPMNIGTWILVSFSGFSSLALLGEWAPSRLKRIGDIAAIVAGLLGLGLSGYTGVLVSNTAVPIWHRPHRLMPLMFLASGITASAGLFDVIGSHATGEQAVSIFGAVGKIAELGCTNLVEENLATVGEVARPFQEGFSGFIWKAAKVLTATSLLLSVIAPRNSKLRKVSGVTATLGSLCLRFAVHYAGQQSALNPRGTFQQQRAGQGAAELTGRAAITGPLGERAF